MAEQELRSLRTLNRVMKALLQEDNFDRMLDGIMGEVLDALGAQRGYLVAPGSDGLEIRSVRNWNQDEIAGETGEFSRTIIRKVIATRQAVLVEDALSSPYHEASVHDLALASILAAPILTPDREAPLGVVYLESRGLDHQFHEEDRELLGEVLSVSGKILDEVVRRMTAEERVHNIEAAFDFKSRFPGIITSEPNMLAVLDTVSQIAQSELAVIIAGESGTGKELIARAVHLNSPRSKRPFVTLNCGAFSDALLESELFGHVKGAFTGAMKDRAGLIESAANGTLFLDEVGEMPLSLQVKLLRAVQFGEYKPVGSDATRTADVRFVSATHRNLNDEVEAGRFRQDLLYRLDGITLDLPPLRDRVDDIPILVQHFIERTASKRHVEAPTTSKNLMDLLTRYRWPGNVRELENEVARLIALTAGRTSVLEPEHLSSRVRDAAAAATDTRHLSARVSGEQKAAIEEALGKEGNNRTRAAKRLGISRETLRLKMKKHSIQS